MRTMNHTELQEMLRAHARSGIRQIPLIYGETGSGKTQAVTQYAESIGAHLETLVLSHLDPADALGIPYRTTVEIDDIQMDTMATATPMWAIRLYSHRNDPVAPVLFLDEYLRCSPDTANTFLNFLTERNINGLDLSFVQIVAATNVDEYTFTADAANTDRTFAVRLHNGDSARYIKTTHGIDLNMFGIRVGNDGVGLDAEAFQALNEPKPLSPRNAEALAIAFKNTNDRLFLQTLHEGFTNTRITVTTVYHPDRTIHNALVPYVIDDEIADDVLPAVAKALVETKKRVTLQGWNGRVANISNSITFNRAGLMHEIEKLKTR